ncbi:LPXTG cell wall anchor domain-containing protein [Clostridium polynesiense]|uniref:LPXTG cell wall anchor domain-containing protein n=1 Tax=Clostridium polynesiense TaxID=1325933 RepID=UPI00058B385B|nr:LPXTG cell wall anchor domain-containing protein [Clostridium polynesiense]
MFIIIYTNSWTFSEAPAKPGTPEKPVTPETPNNPAKPEASVKVPSGSNVGENAENPDTGDNSNMNLIILTAVLSLAGVCVLGYRMKKYNK